MVRVRGHPLGVFDDLAVVIHQVDRAVGSDGEVHGTEPGVGRRQELHALMSPSRDMRRAGRREDVAMDQVLRRLGDEREEPERGRKRATEIHREAAGRREGADAAQHLDTGARA